jgi:hypothetical protein
VARVISPNQRVMSRFMNLTPLFEWGVKMITLLENNQLREEEKTALSFLAPYKVFVFDTYQLLIRLNRIQSLLKSKGFNAKNAETALALFSDMNSDNSLKIKEHLEDYFADLLSKAKRSKTICCSSDILESCFGKYKEIVKGNKSIGISDLCLCIAAMLGENNLDKTKSAMETVRIKQMRKWKKQNVSKTLLAEKRELNRKLNEIILSK